MPFELIFMDIIIISEDGIPKLFDLIGLIEHFLILRMTLGEIGGWRQNGKHVSKHTFYIHKLTV